VFGFSEALLAREGAAIPSAAITEIPTSLTYPGQPLLAWIPLVYPCGK
jgi:hypothetical protein